jgi:hypothetical protein
MADLVTAAQVTAAWPEFTTKVPDANERAAIITAASVQVETICNRVFATGSVTETRDGNGLPWLRLKRPPATAITSVVLDDVTLTTAVDYFLDADTRTLWRGAAGAGMSLTPAWTEGRANIVVTYTGGYTTIPTPVQRATIQLIKEEADNVRVSSVFEFEQLGSYQYRRASISSNGGGVVSRSVALLLAPYILGPFAV